MSEPLLSLAWQPAVTSIATLATLHVVKSTLFDIELSNVEMAMSVLFSLAVPHAAEQLNLTAEWQSDVAFAAMVTVAELSTSSLPAFINLPATLFSRTLGRGIAHLVFGAKSDVNRFYFG